MPHTTALLAASLGTTALTEHPLLDQRDGSYRYRGFQILLMRNSAGSYWAYRPVDKVEGNRWDQASGEAADCRLLAQAMDAIDAWRDGR
jgi:hypothetical protein